MNLLIYTGELSNQEKIRMIKRMKYETINLIQEPETGTELTLPGKRTVLIEGEFYFNKIPYFYGKEKKSEA